MDTVLAVVGLGVPSVVFVMIGADIQHGARTGAVVAPMAAAVRGLDLDGIVAVTAYAASLEP